MRICEYANAHAAQYDARNAAEHIQTYTHKDTLSAFIALMLEPFRSVAQARHQNQRRLNNDSLIMQLTHNRERV